MNFLLSCSLSQNNKSYIKKFYRCVLCFLTNSAMYSLDKIQTLRTVSQWEHHPLNTVDACGSQVRQLHWRYCDELGIKPGLT